MTEKRVIWLVTDYGGEWEDKWDWNVRAFSDEVMAKECAERHEMRMKRDMDEYDDYCGTAVECVELIDAKVRAERRSGRNEREACAMDPRDRRGHTVCSDNRRGIWL